MKEVRLIEIIKTFSEEEIKLFRKFLTSEFTKSRRNTDTMFEYIIQYRPEYDSQDLDNEVIFLKIFPGEKFDGKKISNLLFDLTRIAKDFLIYKNVSEDEIESMLCLSREYYRRNILKDNFTLLRNVESKLVPGFSSTSNYFSRFRQLSFLKNACFTENNDFDKSIESETEYFMVSATQFIFDYVQFLTSKRPALATHGKELENHFTKTIGKCFDIDKLITLTEKEEYLSASLISLHYRRLKTIEEPDNTEHYKSFKEYFYKTMDKLNREEKFYLFTHLQNYCVDKIRKREEGFLEEGFEIYQSMLENNAYSASENEYMEILTFRNIIFFAKMLKKSEWLKTFIEKYSEVVNPDYREDMRNFSFAIYFFDLKDYDSALHHISKKFNHEFFLFKTDLKNLTLRIYYELNYIEPAFSLVDSYKHFLSSTKDISDMHKNDFQNFLKHFYSLLKIKSGQGKETPGFVKSLIEKEQKIINKEWLLEKAAELIKTF